MTGPILDPQHSSEEKLITWRLSGPKELASELNKTESSNLNFHPTWPHD